MENQAESKTRPPASKLLLTQTTTQSIIDRKAIRYMYTNMISSTKTFSSSSILWIVVITVLLLPTKTTAMFGRSSVDCMKCERFVHSTRTLMGYVSNEQSFDLDSYPEVYTDHFVPMLKKEFSNEFKHEKIQKLAAKSEDNKRKVVNVILDVMSYCKDHIDECGWNFFTEYDFEAGQDIEVTQAKGLKLSNKPNFWSLVEHGCQEEKHRTMLLVQVGNSELHQVYYGTLCTPRMACRSMGQCDNTRTEEGLKVSVVPIPTHMRSMCVERAAGVEPRPPYPALGSTEIRSAVQSIQSNVLEQIEKGSVNKIFSSLGVTLEMLQHIKDSYPTNEQTMDMFVNRFIDLTAKKFDKPFWKAAYDNENEKYCESFARLALSLSKDWKKDAEKIRRGEQLEANIADFAPREYACTACKLASYMDVSSYPFQNDPLEACWGQELEHERLKSFLEPYREDIVNKEDGSSHGDDDSGAKKKIEHNYPRDYESMVLDNIMKKTVECTRSVMEADKTLTLSAELLQNFWIQESFVYFKSIVDYHNTEHKMILCELIAHAVRDAMPAFMSSAAMVNVVDFSSNQMGHFRSVRLCRDLRCCAPKDSFVPLEQRPDLVAESVEVWESRWDEDEGKEEELPADYAELMKASKKPSDIRSTIAQFGSDTESTHSSDDEQPSSGNVQFESHTKSESSMTDEQDLDDGNGQSNGDVSSGDESIQKELEEIMRFKKKKKKKKKHDQHHHGLRRNDLTKKSSTSSGRSSRAGV